MTSHPYIQPIVALVDRYRPAFFSRREWWFYLLLFPPIFPWGAYQFMGIRFFQDWRTALVGTPIGITIYWVSVILYTMGVRWVIRQFPDQKQSLQRFAMMLLVVGATMVLTAVFDVWLYSIAPYTGVQFSWAVLGPLLQFGCVFVIGLCLILGLFHSYTQWQDRQTENEQLKRLALQQQYDALKGQVNPHFLFNSLSSISALISEDTDQAERFVDELARVYRYMLQANNREIVPLADELSFIQTYASLLSVRYGNRIAIQLPHHSPALDGSLPPLSLQTLIDNALDHNSMSAARPLVIDVALIDSLAVRVTNTLQRKNRLIDTRSNGLSNLTTKYRQLSTEPVVVEETNDTFSVTLPLV